MQIMLVFEIQIFVHQIQPVDFWFNISYSAYILLTHKTGQILKLILLSQIYCIYTGAYLRGAKIIFGNCNPCKASVP